jgi:competence protein ComEC
MASWGPRAGERWLLPLRWQTNRPSPTEGGFDAQRWMQQQELAALAWVAGGAAQPWGARRLGSGVSLMQALRQEVRDRIASVVVQPRLAGLVAALCMGDQNAIDPADWTIFRRTGVAHLVSISGLHVTLLAVWLAAWADRAMRVWRWRGQPWALYAPAPMVAQWVALAVAGLYAWFSGWGLPAQRTVWMLLATAFLRQLAWHWPPHALWLGLVASVACFDPLALSQPGFWLSYVAVGVLYTVQIGPIEHPLRRWLAETLQVQWRLSLALMPLCLWFYQGVSLAGLWVNLWAIPWVTLVLTPMSLLGLVWAPLWQVAAWAADALLRALAWAADSPWALLEVSRPSLPATVLATLLAVGVVVRWGLRWRCACAVGLWAVLG